MKLQPAVLVKLMVSETQRESVASYPLSAAGVMADHLHSQTELQAHLHHADYHQLSVMVVPGKKRGNVHETVEVEIIREHRLANDLTVAVLTMVTITITVSWDLIILCFARNVSIYTKLHTSHPIS